MQSFSYLPSFGILSTYAPTACGLATFSAALGGGLAGKGVDVSVVRIADGTPTANVDVVGELVNELGALGRGMLGVAQPAATSPSSSTSTASTAVPTATKSSRS